MRARKNPGDDHFQVNQGKLMQREVQTLRQNVSSLREFLHGCQDTINAETAKLEKECLAKIQSLENVRLDLERKCNSLNDEKKKLANASSNLEKRMRHLEKEVDNARKTEAQLRTTSAYLESKLEAKNNEFLSVRKDLERSKMKCLELENKVASNQVYVQEQREVLHEMASDHKQLETSTSSLEFRMAESEAYEKALEGHIAELEAICSILQEKHDEQQKYFLQKEVLYKKDAQAREDSIKTENKNLLTDLEDLKTKLKDERLKCDEKVESCRKLERRNTELEISTERLKEQLETTRDSLQVEKSTVEMLTQKNLELSQQLLHCQSEMRRLKEKNCDKMDKESMDRKALSDIGNTVQQYFEGNNMLAQKIQSSLLAQNKDKLSECEKQLAYERKRRLSAEIQAENLRVELEKAKVESAISRSRGNNSFVIKRSNSTRGYMKIKTANGPQVIENPNMPENTSNERNNDHNYSELLTMNPNGVPNEINLSEPVCNNFDVQDANNRVNILPAAPSAIRLSSGNNHSFQNSSISISPRASQKMEEANKKALELLGGNPKWMKTRSMFKTLLAEPAGNTVIFRCIVQGNPTPIVTWFKDGDAIKKDSRIGGFKHRNNGQMIILESLLPADTGVYMCVATNKYGSINRTYQLAVQERTASRPILMPGFLTNKTVYVGDDVEFRCKAISDPHPHFEWVHHNNGTLHPLKLLIDRALNWYMQC